MGGWAPYFSLAGMLTSSTKNTSFLFTGAPYRVLRFFSSFDSMRYCVSMACGQYSQYGQLQARADQAVKLLKAHHVYSKWHAQ